MNRLVIPKNPAKRWPIIKAALEIRGVNLAALGRKIGVTRQAMYHVQHRPYPAVQNAIADALETRPEAIWPERYDANGQPIRQRPNAPITKPAIRKHYNSQARNAA